MPVHVRKSKRRTGFNGVLVILGLRYTDQKRKARLNVRVEVDQKSLIRARRTVTTAIGAVFHIDKRDVGLVPDILFHKGRLVASNAKVRNIHSEVGYKDVIHRLITAYGLAIELQFYGYGVFFRWWLTARNNKQWRQQGREKSGQVAALTIDDSSSSSSPSGVTE